MAKADVVTSNPGLDGTRRRGRPIATDVSGIMHAPTGHFQNVFPLIFEQGVFPDMKDKLW